MRLSFSEANLASLDALVGVDAAALFIFEDERPLRGLAGLLDWRLCGGLSRILAEGRFTGAAGDALLFPAFGRLGCNRIFCFGAGRRAGLNLGGYAALVEKACAAMSLAGVQGVVTALPAITDIAETEQARIFLADGASRFKGARMVLLGEDARRLAKAFGQAGRHSPALEIDKDPLGSPSPPPPAKPPQPHSRATR